MRKERKPEKQPEMIDVPDIVHGSERLRDFDLQLKEHSGWKTPKLEIVKLYKLPSLRKRLRSLCPLTRGISSCSGTF